MAIVHDYEANPRRLAMDAKIEGALHELALRKNSRPRLNR